MSEPIRAIRNLYQGINPHLQSALQTPGSATEGSWDWPSFHNDHITNIGEFLNDQLPRRYIARTEKSLQIRVEDFGIESRKTLRPQPDVTVYHKPGSGVPAGTAVREPIGSSWTAVVQNTLDISEDIVPAVFIRDALTDQRLGKPVARIELLSPSNKPGHGGYDSYRNGRNDALLRGTPLVELDYVHEWSPTLLTYPRYPKDPDSHAYSIIVSDPRPTLQEGLVQGYGFDVDRLFPIITIPLADKESLDFDFGAVYRYTYRRGRWGDQVDYTQLPARFETYSPADQAHIQRRMALIAEAHDRGDDLEQE